MAQTTKTKVSKRSNVGIQTAVGESLAVGEQEVTVDSLAATSSLEAPQEKIPGPLKDLPEGFIEIPGLPYGAQFIKLNDNGGLYSPPDTLQNLPYQVKGTAEPYNTHWWQGPHIENVPHNPTPKTYTQYEYFKDQDCSFQTLKSFGEQGWQLQSTFVWNDKSSGKQIVHYIFMREKQSA
jgi:hypothetical protein